MGLLDTIFDLSNATVTVTRYNVGTMTAGVYAPGSVASTFQVVVSIQPATGMQRVVAGRDMRSDEYNEHVDDVRAVYSPIELKARTPANDPDTFVFDGSTWTVFRVEFWDLSGEQYWRAVATRSTLGAS